MLAAMKEFLAYLKTAPTVVQALGMLALGAIVFALLASGVIHVPGMAEAKKSDSKPGPSATNTVNVYAGIPVEKTTSKTTDYSPQDGKEVAAPGGVQPVAVATDAMTQKEAAIWHTTNSVHTPKWVFLKGNEDSESNYVKYRYFDKSDGCVEIQRAEQGHTPIDKWIPNPLPPSRLHDFADLAPKPTVDSVQNAALEMSTNDLVRRVKNLLPHETAVLAAGQQLPSGPQYCLNPHAGQYRWYWGPPNGCMQPQYRNFDDGCRHYQLFNTCAGVWDPQIYWMYCRIH